MSNPSILHSYTPFVEFGFVVARFRGYRCRKSVVVDRMLPNSNALCLQLSWLKYESSDMPSYCVQMLISCRTFSRTSFSILSPSSTPSSGQFNLNVLLLSCKFKSFCFSFASVLLRSAVSFPDTVFFVKQ